ncbi:hypothetical protein ALP87_02937 [Pseudomonas syringae pv. coriandricola]|uniref:hypothetical protein n=1 Tax=Pseudomonas syringae group genomosp. 3 TaxID=251701 RepID=UPI000F06F592|nr:hypothetical protein [Pseudomonas syringae group genomosp. 3]RMR34266.1 hypothetical protein ALP87_02937 [Pseudomonas syringae pv. coriandricola]
MNDTRYLKVRIKECLLASLETDFDSIYLQTDLSIDYYIDALYKFINLKAIVHSDFNIIFFFDFKTELIKLNKVKFEERNIFVNVEYKNLMTKRKHKIKYRFYIKEYKFFAYDYKATISGENNEKFIIENNDADICEYGNLVRYTADTTVCELSVKKTDQRQLVKILDDSGRPGYFY